jgi:hypothetical protein
MQNRRDFLKAIGLGAVYLAGNCPLKANAQSAGKPNIIPT